MTAELHANVRDRLARTRQRYTRGRLDLVEMLVGIGRPITLSELVEAGAAASQSSLYRNLAILEQCGVVCRVASVDDVARYELDQELTHHHHHLVCSDCGRVDDVVLPDILEASLHAAGDAVGHEHGYTLESHRLELVGRCGDCA
ncbi:MAG: Fur family ferric uptake transcriptional regulator [Glaciecola sp.]|jgi:Fur family ferric uptake transcriptional regulator